MKRPFLALTVLIMSLHSNTPFAGTPQQCSTRLETALSQFPAWMTQWKKESIDDVPQACIHRAMGVFHEWTHDVRLERQSRGQRNIGHYAYCSDDGRSYVRSHNPPCASDTYLNVISNTYNSALKCLGFKPKNLFAITAVESGFQVNTLSLSGADIGIGQITPVAVDDVNPHWIEYKKRIANSRAPDCQDIQKIVSQMPQAAGALTCDLTALPLNPVRNLIYLSFLHFKNQSYLEKVFLEQGLFATMESLTGRPYTKAEKARVLDMMLTLSYNAGSSGSVNALKAYMKSRTKSAQQIRAQISDLKNQRVTLYLTSEDQRRKGDIDEANALAQQRVELESVLAETQQKLTQLQVPLNDFAITDKLDSFGYYLKSTETSFYLDVLQKRIDYVEASINMEGQCATQNFLQNLAD